MTAQNGVGPAPAVTGSEAQVDQLGGSIGSQTNSAEASVQGERSGKPGSEQIEPSSNLTPDKKVRGRNKSTIKLIEAMYKIAEEAKPITGRGIGYKLFAASLTDSMADCEMNRVYRALKLAREDRTIPWEWIVDETRELELISTWENGAQFASNYFYRRDLWQTQPKRVEVWCEKGTIRGVLWPVLAKLGVGLRVMHGFTSATSVWEACNLGNDRRPLVALYIGDWDPSGLCMSETDLPKRIKEYGGDHIEFRRIALTVDQTGPLPSFSVETKKGDKRYKWFKANYGDKCWELDAMDPRQLRDLVEDEINALIDRPLWEQQEALQAREKQSIELQLRQWAIFQSLNPQLNGGP
jgi:hypothetical protein